MRITDPSADLALALAVASAVRDQPVPAGTVLLGEVGLAGEVRRVVGAGRRLAEANRLGFDRGVVPRDVEGMPKGMKKFEVSNVAQALSTLTR